MESTTKVKVGLSLLGIIIVLCTALVAVAIGTTPQKPIEKPILPQIHNYEYIMSVQDGSTDSTLLYTIYDDQHNLIGTVESNKMDSLIIEDNL